MFFNGSTTILVLILALFNCAEKKSAPKFNLDFESNSLRNKLPDNWMDWSTKGYSAGKDSLVTYHGKYSMVISSNDESIPNSFGSAAYVLPANYSGREIMLEGYLKLEAVKNGFAGLLLRIDGDGQILEFDNMQMQNVSGTQNWAKYSIKLPFHEGAKQIFVAGMLTGKGKVWFDDFKLSIDGEDIAELKPVEPKKSDLDDEFDSGSKIEIEKLTRDQRNRIFKLGKIWGFIKYRHPEIAKGNSNLDYELFRILPLILKEADENSFNSDVINWIEKLGTVSIVDNKLAPTANVKIPAPIDWISDTTQLGRELSSLLVNIEKSERFSENYYIGFDKNVGNPIFKHERSYNKMNFSDDGYRLLSLYRYWNMIQYFYPYRNLLDESWDSTLYNFIPKILESENELTYKLSLLDLIAKINDTHANIWSDDSVLNDFLGKRIAPIEIKSIDDKIIVTKIFDEFPSGSIKVGDVIRKVDDITIEALMADKIKYCPASNKATKLRDCVKRILRTNKNTLTLTLDDGRKITVDCVDFRKIIYRIDDVPSHQLIHGDIGYIYPGTLKKGEILEIMQDFSNTKGLIIDLRCYPSDFIVFSLGNYLVPKPSDFVSFTNCSHSEPGEFVFTHSLSVGGQNSFYRKKVIVIVNEKTQSQAEYTALAFKTSPNVTVIGSTTAGADGNVSTIILPGNIKTMISGIGVYYPNGQETQRVGIVPDVVITPTINGIKEGRDELLDRAISLLIRN